MEPLTIVELSEFAETFLFVGHGRIYFGSAYIAVRMGYK